MQISCVELQGFRKLARIRIDFNDTITLFVGANNSGKTSAMDAICAFLAESHSFTTNDFTLANWSQINSIGEKWLKDDDDKSKATEPDSLWDELVPTLDVWIEVEDYELHHVRGILPTLDWSGGKLGVRLRFEPKDLAELKVQYIAAAKRAIETKTAGSKKPEATKITLWPGNLREFLDRKLNSLFTTKCYLLDPKKLIPPDKGIARPQPLPPETEPVEGKPLNRLIRVNVISAQRGFGSPASGESDDQEKSRRSERLSEQLKSYYKSHLDPTDYVEPSDIEALEAIEEAQKQYDLRLKTGFEAAMAELQDLNYPGVADPILKIGTKLRPVDGLSHSTAVQYEIAADPGGGTAQSLVLPEHYNGLGYQNLISMVFRLMAFRDAWMRVGKASKTIINTNDDPLIPPLHLVLVEEPEAHLHVQVQQVFARKAYNVLRNHPELENKTLLRTQLVVSTHSSHVAHECDFACLRYFRRLPKGQKAIPTSAVINLSDVFGKDNETKRFAARYLLSTHCELFFADAAILVEGAAERMLVPHFIKFHFTTLHKSYVTLLEISGSHSHRLRALIEALGLITLAITDLDSVDPANHRKKAIPKRGAKLVTCNQTLRSWHPGKEGIDDLLELTDQEKVKTYEDIPLFAFRVAYQTPISFKHDKTTMEVIPRTFEDALVLENYQSILEMPKESSTNGFRDAVSQANSAEDLSQKLFDAVQSCNKGEFALDVLFHCDPVKLVVPSYIKKGLEWLQAQFERKQEDLLATSSKVKV